MRFKELVESINSFEFNGKIKVVESLEENRTDQIIRYSDTCPVFDFDSRYIAPVLLFSQRLMESKVIWILPYMIERADHIENILIVCLDNKWRNRPLTIEEWDAKLGIKNEKIEREQNDVES